MLRFLRRLIGHWPTGEYTYVTCDMRVTPCAEGVRVELADPPRVIVMSKRRALLFMVALSKCAHAKGGA